MKARQDAVSWHSENAADFDSKYVSSAAFRERQAVWTELINTFVHSEASLLDAGCGSGVFSVIAARRARTVLGIDPSPEMIALAEAKKRQAGLSNLEFEVAALEDANVLGNRLFDVILCSSVLEYVDDYWRSFDVLAAHLSPNGVVIFSLPNGASLYRRAEKLLFQLTGWPRYYAHVRHVPTLAAVREGLSARSFGLLDTRFYAGVPVLSHIARPLGYPEISDNLFVIVCGRAAKLAQQKL